MQSPLFGISKEERAQLLRYKPYPLASASTWSNSHPTTASTLVFLTGYLCLNTITQDFHEVDSICEAEDLLFSQAGSVVEQYDGLPFALRRQASLLGHKNKRGCGNLIFTNSNILLKIPTDQLYQDEQNTGTKVGRWYSAGVLRKFDNQGSQIFIGEHVPEHTAYVAYKGRSDLDSVATLFQKGHEMRLWCPFVVDIPATIAHYITKVVFDL